MYRGSTKVGATLISATQGNDASPPTNVAPDYPTQLERATRGLLDLNVAVLEQMGKTIGLAPLRALQSLERLGPSLVTALGNDLDMLVSTASRLSDRLADAGLITRRVSPVNRRATILEITDAGRAVLDQLITTRTTALQAVIEHMDEQHREALLVGTRAFTEARHTLTRGAETTT
jgi:DNA-binding MarR family transcriptional regulator